MAVASLAMPCRRPANRSLPRISHSSPVARTEHGRLPDGQAWPAVSLLVVRNEFIGGVSPAATGASAPHVGRGMSGGRGRTDLASRIVGAGPLVPDHARKRPLNHLLHSLFGQ